MRSMTALARVASARRPASWPHPWQPAAATAHDGSVLEERLAMADSDLRVSVSKQGFSRSQRSGARSPQPCTPPRRVLHRGLFAALALLAAGVVGCKPRTLDKAHIEKELTADIGPSLGGTPRSVTCPGDVSTKKGTVFECDVVAADGSTGKVRVTMSGGDKYEWQTSATPAPVAPPPPAAPPPPTSLTIPGTAVDIDAPPGWARQRNGDWGLLTSPDKKVVLAFVAFDRPGESTARIGQIARVLSASTIRWGSQKRGVVGPDRMPATVADGNCQFGGRDSSISYATINPGGSTQILVVYAANDDVPAASREMGLATFRSIRRKR
jgi:hypothetical protein